MDIKVGNRVVYIDDCDHSDVGTITAIKLAKFAFRVKWDEPDVDIDDDWFHGDQLALVE